MKNSTIETKEMTVAQFATKADTQEQKDLVRAISSLQDMIPDIMDFPIVRQQFTFISKHA